MERLFNRKVDLGGPSVLSSTTSSSTGPRFKTGTYYEDITIENGIVCLYLPLPLKAVMAYYEVIRALNLANVLTPVSFCLAGESNQHCKILYENKITCQLSDFVKTMKDDLFVAKVESAKIVYGMSLTLQQIILEIMITFDEMHLFNLVHGRLSMENTGMYRRAVEGKEVYQTKLFGFGGETFEGTDLMLKKNEDWKRLAKLIRDIFKMHGLPMACCAEDLAISFESGPPKPGEVGLYRDHPNFFNMGNKRALINILESSQLDGVSHSVRLPVISDEFEPPSGCLTLERFFHWLRKEFEHDRVTLPSLIANIEEQNPAIWMQLLELSKKVPPY